MKPDPTSKRKVVVVFATDLVADYSGLTCHITAAATALSTGTLTAVNTFLNCCENMTSVLMHSPRGCKNEHTASAYGGFPTSGPALSGSCIDGISFKCIEKLAIHYY